MTDNDIQVDILNGQETISEENNDESINSDALPLLRRAFMLCEDSNWDRARELCEQVLNSDPENAQAYLCELMCDMHVTTQEDLANCSKSLEDNKNFQKAIRFGSSELKNQLQGYSSSIKEQIYASALSKLSSATSKAECLNAAKMFQSISGWSDSDVKQQEAINKSSHVEKKNKKKIILLIASILIAVIAFILVGTIPYLNKAKEIENSFLWTAFRYNYWANQHEIVYFFHDDNEYEEYDRDADGTLHKHTGTYKVNIFWGKPKLVLKRNYTGEKEKFEIEFGSNGQPSKIDDGVITYRADY